MNPGFIAMVTTDKVLLNDWHPVATSKECQINSINRVRLLEEDLVLWRGSNVESTIQVWQDRCPHRGVRLSLGKVVNDSLVCGYHGWQYNLDGQCFYIPANPQQKPPTGARVRTYQCQERYGLVWVCLGEPTKDVAAFPEWDDADYRQVLMGPYNCNSSPFRTFENGFDVSHFCFAHEGFVGDSQQAQIEDYEVEVDRDGIIVRNLKMWQPDHDGTGVGGKVTYLQRICPLTLYSVKHTCRGRMIFFFTVTPVEEEKCLVWMWVAMNYGDETPDSKLREFQDKLFRQDTVLLESHRPVRLPLVSQKSTSADYPTEVHAQCDRTSIAYRRWLKDLGVTFGVC
ncbi:aromatic ring-hydroxylating dioxygenase subunit alpha [Plectonema radiosum NIES-515]|uniref:Aromatic ring-hydroxylating dioxygenase subunit alpha n=1 Tax=Plectonema radiosum NIES-515 TaxID=2986073 RepID=A0ABT3AXD0_9CYAN|nr:aromatic ring-hydroxylating dioxygenase subunit alpha [Plectonema radiosum]MCV3213756.1 aromatic ring-hydroxylating dioxygenase subunit alpha [Plectonema radiosum NIES-515]